MYKRQVWLALLQRHGYTEREAREYVAGPAFFPWQCMMNLTSWGGPAPAAWYENRCALSRKINAYLLSFGAGLVLPGYAAVYKRQMRILSLPTALPDHFDNFIPKLGEEYEHLLEQTPQQQGHEQDQQNPQQREQDGQQGTPAGHLMNLPEAADENRRRPEDENCLLYTSSASLYMSEVGIRLYVP